MKTLLTPRLSIDPCTLDDAPFILALLNDPGWLRYIGDKNVRTLDDARAYLRNGPIKMMAEHGVGLCIVRRRSDGERIGTCGLFRRAGLDDVDLGVAFMPEARGQGYAAEAAVSVLAYGLHNLGLKRIVAITTLDNDASGRLLERIGMRLEGNTRLPGEDEDLNLYGVDRPPTEAGALDMAREPAARAPAAMPSAAPEPVPVDLPRAYRLLNHGPTVLVSAAHDGRRNTMAAAWNMALDFDPPKVAVVLDKATYTRTLIEASGRFMLSLPTRAQAALTTALGGVSGRALDKAELGLRYLDAGPGKGEPELRVAGCVGWLECRVIPEPHIQQAYDLFVADVVAAWADPRVYSDGRWHFEGHDDLRTLHHVAGGQYFVPGDSVR
jgi:flavin reductase (DIM6/NTAB) family NADH-FMN oxidoreductase RutF/RimJ/RimL family protein N-acetyltransferase